MSAFPRCKVYGIILFGETYRFVTPAEFEKAFAALVVDSVGSDRLEIFLELVRLAAESDFYEML